MISINKETVNLYIEGFRETNHKKILDCLTDDVEWLMPGYFHLQGKLEFDKEIENDAFEGKPDIQIYRLTEENNIVIAEGAVQCEFRDGNMLSAVFCDVFEFRNSKIAKLTTYQINKS